MSSHLNVSPTSLSTSVPLGPSWIRPVSRWGAARDDESFWLWFSRAMAMIRTLLDNPCPLMWCLCATGTSMSRPWCARPLPCEALRCNQCNQCHLGLPRGLPPPDQPPGPRGHPPRAHEAAFGISNQAAEVCGSLHDRQFDVHPRNC